APLVKRVRGMVSAVPYDYNVALTELAIENGTHMVDLGGNNSVVQQQLHMNEQARTADVAVIPDCGLAPGMVSVIAAYGIDQLARADEVNIRVGGLPVNPQTPLNYKLVFSVHGLINEYIEPAVILRNGHRAIVDSMEGLEALSFPRPFQNLEAFYTSGGTSTLPDTFEGQVNHLDYKTIRYPGHAALMKAMMQLGFTDAQREIDLDGKKVSARQAFEALLDAGLHYESDDVVLIRVTVKGRKEGSDKTLVYEAVEYGDPRAGLTAMMRTTAFPVAITLQMILDGKIKDRGVLKQELSVPGWEYMWELKKRDIDIRES
ncbi:MAG TPA: saccharopine dehydrogenase, partial [Caldithrix abyssi]|nr:saccharopine dehydrogenase [Caldithrix abyssi]